MLAGLIQMSDLVGTAGGLPALRSGLSLDIVGQGVIWKIPELETRCPEQPLPGTLLL
jgi:hypothetical protein